jgi:hypothetical protein
VAEIIEVTDHAQPTKSSDAANVAETKPDHWFRRYYHLEKTNGA